MINRQTGKPLGTFHSGDAHPTIKTHVFYHYANNREVWLSRDAYASYKDRKRQKSKQTRRRMGIGPKKYPKPKIASYQPNVNTGFPRGTFKFGDPHPYYHDRIFKSYFMHKRKNDTILRESWLSQDAFNKHKRALRKESGSRVSKQSLQLLSGDEKKKLKSFYSFCQMLNRTHNSVQFHVDHIHPLSTGGQHHPDNLRIATASWNSKKGNRFIG